MPRQICTGAVMGCSFGAAPAIFNATPRPVFTSQCVAGVVTDHLPIANVPPFGLCSSLANPQVAAATAAAMGVLTPMPCVPALPTPWVAGAPTTLIGQVPALDEISLLACAWGGLIAFRTPGQTSHLIP